MVSRAVCYAITGDRKYLTMARSSVASLRRYNSSVPIHLFCFGPLGPSDRAFFKVHHVLVHRQPRTKIYPYFIKWLVLHRVPAEKVLFLDADTVLYSDIEKIFSKHSRSDFYARREIGTLRKIHYIGRKKMWRQIDHRIMKEIFNSIGTSEIPVFNAGIMIFNHGFHRKLKLETIKRFYNQLVSGKFPYPSPNHFIRDEIACSLAMSTVPGFTWSALRKKEAPFFLELKERAVKRPGLAVHVITSYYEEFKRSPIFKDR